MISLVNCATGRNGGKTINQLRLQERATLSKTVILAEAKHKVIGMVCSDLVIVPGANDHLNFCTRDHDERP